MGSRWLSIAGALGVILFAGGARAEDKPDTVRASALFAEGRRLMAAGDFGAACPKLAESQALDPQPDTALDLGICYEKASELAFKAAHELARSPESGTAAPSTRAPVMEAASADAPPPGRTQRIVGLTLGGVGAAGVVAGVVAGVMAKAAYDDASSQCMSNVCLTAYGLSKRDSAMSLATVSTISFIGGALGLGAGAIVYFTAPSAQPGAGRAVGVGPATEGAGVSLVGRF